MPRYRTFIDITDKETGNVTLREVRKKHEADIYEYLYDFYTGTPFTKVVDVYTLAGLYPEWMEYKKAHTKADSNIPRVQSTWNKYYADSEIVNTDIRRITVLQLDLWIHKNIRDHEMNRRKFNNFILILRQMLRYAVLRDIIPQSPLDKVETQVFTQDEEDAIVALAWQDYQTNERMQHPLACLAVIFQFITGRRVGELCAIRYEDIRGNYLKVQRMATEQYKIVNRTKSWRGNRKVFLTEEALSILQETLVFHRTHGEPDAVYVFGGKEHIHGSAHAVCGILAHGAHTALGREHTAPETHERRLADHSGACQEV